eukprot:jgi/Tetstr1/421341/TSEL_012311.t1
MVLTAARMTKGMAVGVDVGVAAVASVAARVGTSDGVGRLSSELLALCEATFRLHLDLPRCGASYIYSREAFGSTELGHRTLDLLSSSLSVQTLKSYAGRLSQFAEFCHDSENISPLEATTANVVRCPFACPFAANVADNFVDRAESIVFAPFPQYQYDFQALVASVVNFMFFARGLASVSCRVRDVHVDDYNITLQVYREKGRAGRRGPDDLRVLLLP